MTSAPSSDIDIPVCVIGCGPIGLAGALLLSRHGVRVLLVERRGELNSHPRSRFVDTNTMELFRELGIADDVEATGLGPDWTAFNRWSDSLAAEAYATIPSPTFLTAPRSTSPCVPVMTAQDCVEEALMSRIIGDPNITVRFNTEATEVRQTSSETLVKLRNTLNDERQLLRAQYIVGADGPGSGTREVIGTRLEADPRPVYSQDVIFRADLEPYVGDRKGSLLYATTPLGIVIFQALDGMRRWRCQVVGGDENLLPEEAIKARILAGLGTEDDVELTILSMRMWQPTPGCVTQFSRGRIFLAGDAAHVSVPTGGMGNNIGFAGVRNLAWKIAYVVRGLAPRSILDTYETEHRPIALERIDFGVQTTTHMGRMMLGRRAGEDVTEHIDRTHQYADYDHVLLGCEMASDLIAPNALPVPHVEKSGAEFVPLVRSGRRAPHAWLDEERTRSVLDWFGSSYVLVVGADCPIAACETFVDQQWPRGLPVDVRQLPAGRPVAPYGTSDVVLVRPDGVIADHRAVGREGAELCEFLAYLPIGTD